MKIHGALMTLMLLIWGIAQASPTEDAIQAILDKAKETESSGIVILRNGEVAAEWLAEADGAPIETMSVTKSILALGVARMLTTGELESLDTPVADMFPEWRQGRKADITVRHLLNHTSGLQNHPNAGEEIYPSPDVLQLALAAELDHAPGEHFAYNNKATNLIAGFFEPLTGRDAATYLDEELLTPLGIDDWQWMRDEAGNPYGMAGLRLHPHDLARLGQLVLDRGRAGQNVLIDDQVLTEFLDPGSQLSESAGLLWWRQPAWERWVVDDESLTKLREAEVDPDFVDRLQAAAGSYDAASDLHQALATALGENWRTETHALVLSKGLTVSRPERSEQIVAYYGAGYLGQYLVVVPKTGIVGVRMIRSFDGVGPEHGFPEFRTMVGSLP